jgi:tetratricopeptide (TPR) repeat protein
MTPNRFSDTLFQLVHSLQKAEKRHFKLYIKRSSGNEDLKIVELFDALDKLSEYDEVALLKKLKSIQKPQLANIKVHLYKQLLASLRLLKSGDSIDLQLNEQFDYAHILYKKGLFAQSLKILDKAKETAKHNHKINFLPNAIALEKRIETLHITPGMQTRATQLTTEINDINRHIDTLAKLSNLAMLLQSWFIDNGHARNAKDEERIKAYLKQHLPGDAWQQPGFYEKLYLYQSYCWYTYIRQDFLYYYRNAQRWVDIFDAEPLMIRVETGHYIKGLHTLLNAHFTLRNYQLFDAALKKFERFAQTDRVRLHDNFRTQAFVYIYSAKINFHSITGTFSQGVKLVPEILEQLQENELFIDEHRIMVINYKIASMYFGNGDYSTCIDYLQRIINENAEVRNDLQSYSRLMHLLAHYEMGNYELMEYLAKAVLRFMDKKQNLTVVEEELLKFLRKPFNSTRAIMQQELEKLLSKIKGLEKNRFETRAFAYLDIISWLESKVQRTTMADILQQKYKQSRKRKYMLQ